MSKRLRLNVPLVRQDLSMECWYASACMVCYFHVAGPRLGVPQAWKANQGLPFENFSTLAKNESMKPLLFARDHQFTQDEIVTILERDGPIWAWGMWSGFSHIVVVTGADDPGEVYLNDPDGPRRWKLPIAEFNRKLVRNFPGGSDPLMVFDRTAMLRPR